MLSKMGAETQPQNEMEARQAFAKQMETFLQCHGTSTTDVDKLLDYAAHKTNARFYRYCGEWTAESDRIKYHFDWMACSFFDDGGGEEGHRDWSMSFIALDGDFPIQNEKLDDFSPYPDRVNDSFYCVNPFGLKGIYEIRFDGEMHFFD